MRIPALDKTELVLRDRDLESALLERYGPVTTIAPTALDVDELRHN